MLTPENRWTTILCTLTEVQQPCAQTRPLPLLPGTYVISGVRRLLRVTRGRPATGSHGSCGWSARYKQDRNKNLHPATQLSGGLLRPSSYTQPTCLATPSRALRPCSQSKVQGKTRVCLASTKARHFLHLNLSSVAPLFHESGKIRWENCSRWNWKTKIYSTKPASIFEIRKRRPIY